MLQVLFSSYIQKTNRFNKCADRALLITDSDIYKLETKKFKPMRKGSPIQEVPCINSMAFDCFHIICPISDFK
jgi:myosin-1